MSRDALASLTEDVLARRMSRKDFIRRAFAAGMSITSIGIVLAACGEAPSGRSASPSASAAGAAASASAAPAGPVKINVYSYITTSVPYQQILDDYTRSTGVQIQSTSNTGGDQSAVPTLVQKYSLEARTQQATYDIILGPTPWLEVAPLVDAGALAPVDEFIPKDLLDAMPKAVRDESTYKDGKIYSLPIWADIMGFIYRKDLLGKILGSDKPPTTWDEVLSFSEKLKGGLPSNTSAYGADWYFAHRMFLPLMYTYADSPYTKQGTWDLGSDAALTALNWIKKLYPYMPANSQADIGSSKTFQAGKLAMESYWQAQRARAITAGIPADQIGLAANPSGSKASTLFWGTGAVLLKNSPNKKAAIDFLVNAMLKNKVFLQASYEQSGKIVPYSTVPFLVTIPDWAKPLQQSLDKAHPIPMNPYFLNIEEPIYQEEVGKMILQGQSAEQTRTNMATRIEAKVAAG